MFIDDVVVDVVLLLILNFLMAPRVIVLDVGDIWTIELLLCVY